MSVGIPRRTELPSGTVTFVFTDIEGSTKQAHALGTERWRDVLVAHAAVVRAAALRHDGVEVRTEGDSFFLAFRTARQAVAAAAEAQRALARREWPHGATVRVRVGMHTGENAVPGGTESGADYVGFDVHRAARVAAAAHGGQVLISSATRTLLGDQLPAGVTLRDLGEHRLKDLPDPDRLWQLVIEGLQSDFAAPRTLSSAPNNITTQLTSFIGRRAELAEARALLDRSRLLTLVGPGGTGKTRLSIELASHAMSAFPDGVWVVRLAPVSDPALVASTIAQALGLVVPAGRMPIDHVTGHLRERRALLVLDNFEQVVAAAQDVGRILESCPQVKVIVTTRIVLRIGGEQEYPVPPLTLPDPGDVPDVNELSRAEAVQLFVDRARSSRPDFALTAENARAVVGIVAHLDGLPLAIELAAARVKVLPPQAILERLASGIGILQSSARDVPARQQTLRGAISWSYDLLDAGLRRLFQRLSVFRGGAALEQVEQVCGPADEIERDVFDGVSELVDHSLLRRVEAGGEARFVMLETIREYARERLEESGEGREIQLRHAHGYLALAERAQPYLRSQRRKEWLDRLELEHGNLRAAFDEAARTGTAEVALRLVAALWRFWQFRGHLREGRQRAEQALAVAGARGHARAYVSAVDAAGGLAYWSGDIEATRRYYAEQRDLARQLGDPAVLANALYNYGFTFIVTETGGMDLASARTFLDEALHVARGASDMKVLGDVLWGTAGLHQQAADFAGAQPYYDEATALYRQLSDQFGLAWASRSSGLNLLKQGLVARARERIAEGIQLMVAADDLSGLGILLNDMAEVLRAEGNAVRAQRLRGASAMITARTGADIARISDVMEDRVADFASDQERAAFDDGTRMTVDEAVAYALERPILERS